MKPLKNGLAREPLNTVGAYKYADDRSVTAASSFPIITFPFAGNFELQATGGFSNVTVTESSLGGERPGDLWIAGAFFVFGPAAGHITSLGPILYDRKTSFIFERKSSFFLRLISTSAPLLIMATPPSPR